MRRLLYAAATITSFAATAHAADLRSRPVPPPVMAVPVYNWSGFYVGGHLGGAWADTDVDTNFGVVGLGGSTSAFILGGQLGFNWQIGSFVWGGEFDFSWADGSRESGFIGSVPFGPIQANIDNNWLITVVARFGFAIDRWFLYGKVGGGWYDVTPCKRRSGVWLPPGAMARAAAG